MQPDARLEDVILTLADPEEYVRGALESFHVHRFNRNEAVMRIGVSGSGVRPHISIEEGEKIINLPNGICVKCYKHRVVLHGSSRKSILEDEWMGINWSSSKHTYADIQSLLARLRTARRQH